MLSPSPSSQLLPLPQPTHPPPPPTINDPSSSFGFALLLYLLSSFLPLLIVFCCFAYLQRLREHANQPQHQDIELGIPRNPPPQRQQQQQQQAPREVPGTVVNYRSHERIANCSDCAICLEDFREGELCRVLDGCKHMYHKACIDTWLTRDKHCPLCRGSVRGGAHSNSQKQIWTELQIQQNMI